MAQTVAEFRDEVMAMLAEEGWEQVAFGPAVSVTEKGLVSVYALNVKVGGQWFLRTYEVDALRAQPDPVAWLREEMQKGGA